MKIRDSFLDLIMKDKMKQCEVVLEDCLVTNAEEEGSNVFVIEINMQITQEDTAILENTCAIEKDMRKVATTEGKLRSTDYWKPLEKQMRL